MLDLSKFKAFVDDKIKVTENFEFALGMVPAFSRFPTLFSKGVFLRVVRTLDCPVQS